MRYSYDIGSVAAGSTSIRRVTTARARRVQSRDMRLVAVGMRRLHLRSPDLVMKTSIVVVALAISAALVSAQPTGRTLVVMLGTGTPNADPERFGPAVAVVVDDASYLVDFGVGVVRRAAAA